MLTVQEVEESLDWYYNFVVDNYTVIPLFGTVRNFFNVEFCSVLLILKIKLLKLFGLFNLLKPKSCHS